MFHCNNNVIVFGFYLVLIYMTGYCIPSNDMAHGKQQQQQSPEWRINEKIRRKFRTVQTTLDCHERSFTFKAIQTDPITGLQCRDYIKLLSCWGRCNSGEISDYRFPYKRSFHNVCIHDVIEQRLFELTDCDPGAPDYLRWYRTVVAKSCVCRQCETSMVNCESASIDLDLQIREYMK